MAQPSGSYGTDDAYYSIPSGAYFVSPNGTGSAPCGENNPCALSTALQKAPRGTTIVFKEGTYRTSKYSTTIPRRMTLQPYPGANVILKGSEVKRDWVASGNVWKGNWLDLYGKPNNDDGRAVGIENPMADHRDMVYVNGQSQKQVSSLSEVGPGEFYVDYTSKVVYIGTDPSSKQVEISAEWWGLNTYGVSEDGINIRGLKLMHYTDAGIFIGSPGAIIENCEVVWNGAAGIRVQHADDVVLKNSLFAYNACQGGGIAYSDRVKLVGNSFNNNNLEKYNRNSWSPAGVKILWSKEVEVRNNSFVDNDANGLWLDEKCNGSILVNNFAKNNARNGIHCEITDDVIIAGNVVLESGKNERFLGAGISVANSSDVKVYNNTLYNNEIALDVFESTRGDEKDPNDPYITRNTVIKNNILSEAFISQYPSALYHMKKKECDDYAIDEQDYNAYYRSTAGKPSLAVRWKINNNVCNVEERLETIQEFRTKLGYEQHGFGIQGGDDPFFIDAASGNFNLKSTSMAIKSGAPLPEDIAQAMGWESGVVVDMGAFQTDISHSPTPETGILPWVETFTTSDGATDDNGFSDGSSWNLDRGSMSSNAAFKVMDSRLQARGTVGEGSWRSEQVNIEGQIVDLSLMLYSQGDLEDKYNPDYIKVYYKVDGVDYLLKEVKGGIGSAGIKVSISEIIGKQLELIVKFKNSDYTEFYFLDNIEVISTGNTEPKAEITDINLIDKENANTLEEYDLETNTVELDKSELVLDDLDIHVEVEGDVGSVVFDFNDIENYSIDNTAPYSLHEEESASLPIGENTIKVRVYSEAEGKGILLSEKVFSFLVKETLSNEAVERWYEDFSLPMKTRNDFGSTAWNLDASTVTPSKAVFQVENDMLRLSETSSINDAGYVTWVSETINISGQPAAKINFEAKYVGIMEDDIATGDFINVFYKVDEQPLQAILKKYGGFEHENQWYQFEQNNIKGKKLQIIIQARTTTDSESYFVDNMKVSEDQVERPVQSLPWQEDFAGANDLLEQQDATAWFFSQVPHEKDEMFGVREESLYFSQHASVTKWSSYPINITGAQSVKIGFDIKEVGKMEAEGPQHDFIKVYYRLDKGEMQPLLIQDGNLNVQNEWVHIEKSGLAGDTLEIFIEGKTSANSEFYFVDNITIEDEHEESSVQALPWYESFEGANGVLSQTDNTAWFFSSSGDDQNGIFGIKEESIYISMNSNTVEWSTEPINITTAESVKVSLDIKEIGDMETSGTARDFLNIYYRVNGGSMQPILEHNGNLEKDGQWIHIEAGGIQGETLEIVIESRTSAFLETFYIDNISVQAEGIKGEEAPEEEIISTLTIYAAGKSGYETMELRIDGQAVMSWDYIGGNVYDPIFEEYVYEHRGAKLMPSQVQLVYVSDGEYQPYAGIRVDKINIDGEVFETEASTTYGVGIYVDGDCQEGYLQDESLQCGGYFRFMATEIENYFLEVNAYPNPTQGDQTVEFTTNLDQVTVRIIDMQGNELVKYPQVNTSNTLQLDLSLLKAGIYILHVSSESKYAEMRIYKE
ncbi:right-handed parallel beta-helix repeat-containing protein [Catalinimonas sp. 4WD22]|uniref:right-handed parallel beta-helix repeat-containing protein n=1 Tax=Catalinimonas locisalis TaxID=3133978 RepID=UPI00310196ED